MDPPQVVHRLDLQAHERGRGGGRGPKVDQDDVESTAAEMLRVTNRPHGTVIVVDARGFKSQRKDTRHVGAYYQNLRDIAEHRDFEPLWAPLITKLRQELANAAASSVPINVACKRRSVSLARLLTQYLRKLNYSVDLWHSMREYWHIGSCRECDLCARGSPDKLRLVQTLLERRDAPRRRA